MNLFSLISLSVSLCCLILAVFIFRNANKPEQKSWGFFNLVICGWSFNLFLVGISSSPTEAKLAWRVAYAIGSFAPCVFYHFVYNFCRLRKKRTLLTIYFFAIIFSPIVLLSPDFIQEIVKVYDIEYYYKATTLYSMYMIYVGIVVVLSFVEMLKSYRSSIGMNRKQLLYAILAFGLGWGGGITTFLPPYGIPIWPLWHVSICFYMVLMTYAVLRYKFFDLQILLSRLLTPIFISGVIFVIYCYFSLNLSLFAMAGLSLGVACLLLASLVFVYARKGVHKVWAVFNIVVGVWGLGTFFVGISKTYESAILSWKFTYSGGILIAVLFYQVVCSFTNINRKRVLLFGYTQGICFILLNLFHEKFLGDLRFAFNSFYYNQATVLYSLWFLIWITFVFLAFYELYRFIRSSKGIYKIQASYLFWGMLLGFTGGATTVIPAYNISVYPAWHFTICLYAAISTYAIFKYQIMDIKIAITRLGIFVLVYSLVLGLPFGLVMWGQERLRDWLGEDWFWVHTIILLVSATVGPYIYFFIQKKAEDRLLLEETRRHSLLTKASIGMNTIHDLSRLAKVLMGLIESTFKIKEVVIFLYNKDRERYELKSHDFSSARDVIAPDSALVRYLYDNDLQIVNFEEVEFNTTVADKKAILADLQGLTISLLIPIAHDNQLLGFISMPSLSTDTPYSKNDIDVLAVLGSNVGMAIDSCHAWDEHTRFLDEKGHLERMSSLDMMAGSIAHEIHNPVHAVVQEVDFMQTVLKDIRHCLPSKDYDELNISVSNVGQLADRITSMVNTILRFSKHGDTEMQDVWLSDIVKDFEIIVLPYFKKEHISYHCELPDEPVALHVNRVLLVTALMNFSRNSIYAMRHVSKKKVSLKIYRYSPIRIWMEFQDNGCGIEPHRLKAIFTAFQTSKGSSEGTGLGLYRARRDIVDHFKGRIWAESKGAGLGTTIFCELPTVEKKDTAGQ